MLLGDNDAEGEPDPEALLDELQRASKAKGKHPEGVQDNYSRYEEEESEPEKPLAQTTVVQPPQPRKPPLMTAKSLKASTSGKNTPSHAFLPPKPPAAALQPHPPLRNPAKPAKSSGTKRERPPNQDNLPKPTPPKRQKAAPAPAPKKPPPPPKEDFVLELPGSTSIPVLPPAPVPVKHTITSSISEPQPILAPMDDSDEEEWDDVMVPVPVPPVERPQSPPARVIVLEEIDPTTTTPATAPYEDPSDLIMDEDDDFAAALEKDLQEQLFDDDMEEVVPAEHADSQPLGEEDNLFDDPDDYSSSDDSDDD